MHQRRLDHLSLDLDLLIARRRADACSPGSPSWDAAMGLVQELEEALQELEQAPDVRQEFLTLSPASN
ncbi:MAG: hypothetical protein HY262_01655 [Chloroflexi bacterium]|nr:hypothetical protein [Chloroflexota bacterium]